jgi:ABC-type phosphate/phosphonate transport system substrate-binding protein
MGAPLVLGAVAYDPKVVTIWEGFASWFAEQDFAFDYVLYSNYETQAEAHLRGDVDVTWDSPLAWVRTRRLAEAAGRDARAVAMRDTDQDLTSVVLVRADGDVEAPDDLSGRVVATGALDSPQATLLPLAHLAGLGLEPGGDVTVRRFDVMVGKHGDHVGGERDAVRALVAGDADAACVIDGNYAVFAKAGIHISTRFNRSWPSPWPTKRATSKSSLDVPASRSAPWPCRAPADGHRCKRCSTSPTMQLRPSCCPLWVRARSSRCWASSRSTDPTRSRVASPT